MAETQFPLDPVIEGVRADLLSRQQFGYQKYGGTLAANPADLKGKLQHAYEEALDLCNYLKWSIMQLDGSAELAPDATHNTGLKSEFTDQQRERLAAQVQTWIENHDPKLLANVSTGALRDELHRRQMAVLGDQTKGVSVPVCTCNRPVIGRDPNCPAHGHTVCPHGLIVGTGCPDCELAFRDV